MKHLAKKIQKLLKKEKKPRQGYFLGAIGVAMLIGVGILLFESSLFTPNAEDILPERDLLFFAETDEMNCSSVQIEKRPVWCSARDKWFVRTWGEFPQRISSFADKAVFALYEEGFSIEENRLLSVQMFRIRDSKAAEDFLRNLGENTDQYEIVNGIPVFPLPDSSKQAFFWNGWLFLSEYDLLLSLLQEKEKTYQTLSSDENFQILRENSWGESFIYITKKGIALKLPSSWASFLQFSAPFGLWVDEKSDEVTLHVLSALLKTGLEKKSPENKALKQVVSRLSEDDILLLGAAPAPRETVEMIFSLLESEDLALSFSARALLRDFLQDSFGKDFSLEYDLLPLLEGNIAFGVGEKKIPFFVSEMESEDFLQKKKDRWKNFFQMMMATHVPRKVSYTLSDGSEIQEIIVCEDCISEEEEDGLTLLSVESESGKIFEAAFGTDEKLFLFAGSHELGKKLWKERAQSSFSPGKDLLQSGSGLLLRPELLPENLPFSDFSFLSVFPQTNDSLFHLVFSAQ